MPDTFRIGPAHLFIGDPGVAAGAGMIYLGLTKGNVVFDPGIRIATGMADQSAGVGRSDAVFRVGMNATLSAPLLDEAKTKLVKLLHGSSVVTASAKTALALGSGFQQITEANVPTLAVIPQLEIASGANGIDAPNAIWLPAVVVEQFGELTFNLPEEGEDTIFSPRNTVFRGLRRVSDWASANGGVIPDAGKCGWMGPPGALGLANWSLPAAVA